MTFRGHVKDGVVVLDGPERLPDGATVDVSVVSAPDSPEDGATLFERYRDIVGKAKGLPADAARNIDHYLYGAPKRP